MFQHLSLRPQDDHRDAVIATEMKMARKGVGGRIAFAVVIGGCSVLWLSPWAAAAYVGAIIFWELVARPWATPRAVAALRDRGDCLSVYYRTVILLIACLYAVAPLTGVLSGMNVGWFLAVMAFCSAVISGVTYFSNDKWQFAACTAPSFVIACSAPFVFGVAPHIAVVVLALNAFFALSALQSAVHRGELVESVAKEEAARARAENANVEKSQFIANVSHELRSPLNAIIGYSEILREAAEEDARRTDQEDLDRVLLASRRLLHLVNELLDISKIEAGKLSLNVSWFDAAEMIDSAVITTRSLADASGKRVMAEISDELGQGVSDEFRLSQCVANLVSGALLCAERDVTLRARRMTQNGGEWFDIEVLAAGAKLDAAAIERLFDPFAQADEANRGGASLGLAITRRVARLLGGDVSAECRPDGAIFSLRTPVLARVSGVRVPAEPVSPARAA
jgi:signal transduction histidine kinase